MSLYFTVPFLMLVAILQATLTPRLNVGGVRPDLMLLVVVSWSLRRGMAEGSVWAFVGGLALDLFSGAPLGASALALMAAAILADVAQGSLMRSQAALPWIVAGASTLVYYVVMLAVLAIAQYSLDARQVLLRHALPAAVYNVVVVAAIYGLMTWLDQRTGEPELRW